MIVKRSLERRSLAPRAESPVVPVTSAIEV